MTGWRGAVGWFVAASACVSAEPVFLAGTFNDWNAADPQYQMTAIGSGQYRLTKFFRAGQYKFKFTVNGNWANCYGVSATGALTQPGEDIPLRLVEHGAYTIVLDRRRLEWSVAGAPLAAPQAVLHVRGPVAPNLPVVLDGAESVAPPGREISRFTFTQDTNDAVRASLRPTGATATVVLPREGTYRFWLHVDRTR
jgi:hypothetical protein